MNQPAKIKRQIEAIEDTLHRLEEAKEALRVDSHYMKMNKMYMNNRAKLMKKYNNSLFYNIRMAAETIEGAAKDCKLWIVEINNVCRCLNTQKIELKERLENGR